jgi:hypothetical protein
MTVEQMTSVEKYNSGLTDEAHNKLTTAYNTAAGELKDVLDSANKIEVTTASDTEGMQAARAARLSLRKIRIEVEKTRKTLKEDSLREGKAIDGMANVLKFLIEPVEKRLQEMENFAAREAQRIIDEMVEKRSEQLRAVDVDPSAFKLGEMSQEAFESLLSSSTLGYNAKIEAEKKERQRIEEERKAEEKRRAEQAQKDKEERERIEAENAKLRAEKEAAEKEAARIEAEKEAEIQKEREENERLKREQEEAQAKRIAEEEKRQAEEAAKAKAIRDAEEKRIEAEKKAEQKRLAAPDREKLAMLDADICALTMPTVSSEVAMDALQEVKGILNDAVKRLRSAAKELAEK